MLTTVDATIERVRRSTLLGSYGPFYQLESPADADDTTLTLDAESQHINEGSILAVDYELMRVKTLGAGAATVTVQRGFLGTEAAAHDAGALVEQNARVPKAMLLDEAELEIRSWGRELFRIVALPLDATRNERTYDLAGVDDAGIDFLLEVRSAPVGVPVDDGGSTWAGDTWPKVGAKLLRNMPLADLPTGYGLQLTRYPRAAGALRVAYASPFVLDPFAGGTDLVDDVGLDPNWIGVLEAGLRARALNMSMVSRTDWRASGASREAEQVSLLDLVRAADMARSQRDARFASEVTKLRARYPYRSMT